MWHGGVVLGRVPTAGCADLGADEEPSAACLSVLVVPLGGGGYCGGGGNIISANDGSTGGDDLSPLLLLMAPVLLLSVQLDSLPWPKLPPLRVACALSFGIIFSS